MSGPRGIPRNASGGPVHSEVHKISRVGWLRAAVMGANDGIVSTASLIIGVSAAGASQSEVMTAGIAGLVAGAMSMAAGEYVSVSTQSDNERAELSRERQELEEDPVHELRELTAIYRARGLSPDLAHDVAVELTEHDALAAHARDELGISELSVARPVQAALTSAATFAVGALLPLLSALLASGTAQIVVVAVVALIVLSLLGAVGALAGGAPLRVAAFRVTFWGALAMGVTTAIGFAIGSVV